MPAQAWTPAYDADGQIGDGAWVAELTGLFDLTGWPPGMRLIFRKERPHPGAQLCVTDVDGHRITAFVTNTRRGQLADLELRHRRRARAEHRILCAKDSGLTNLPLHIQPPLADRGGPHEEGGRAVVCGLLRTQCGPGHPISR